MQQFTKVILACDESGAKGYADQNETYPGEVGVFAGIMVPDTHLPTVEPVFKSIYDRYKPATGKLHITDLDDAAKAKLRRDIYDAISRLQLPCFWYAIHVAGLHAFHLRHQELRQMAKKMAEEARGGEPPRVKRGSPREEPASMHVELFAGLYGHLIAFLEEKKGNYSRLRFAPIRSTAR
ncbi:MULTISPECIES: hypothetical protein [unclassified Methylobacterium]|jgi:hypothetical protein|uniref:hypothetical protein n=1 Tax=unclassified Methylobacterium TaxID=2615210 RepID=UPI00135580D3|nr:hypothetical protein [Methylobacterium sp. 2A]MWV25199.1 hypothetical protein [Methylobacterium sp. 2A]